MKSPRVKIHLIFPLSRCHQADAASLTPGEIARAARFRFLKDSAHWISCRAAMREILGNALGIAPSKVPLLTTRFGKPFLAPPHSSLYFNLSHTQELALLAISTLGPLGIDLEPLARAEQLLSCEASFCHPQEIDRLPAALAPRSLALLHTWTAKEALLKSLGTGLSFPPEQIQILFENSKISALSNTPAPEILSQRIYHLGHKNLMKFSSFLSIQSSDSINTPDSLEFIDYHQ